MNARKSKQIRKLAEANTIGMPYAQYQYDSPGSQTIVLSNCTRKEIKRLKRTSR